MEARQEAGFTLLEVLVAFVIAAIALGALYQGAISGLLGARVATQYEEATSRARSHLAAIRQDTRLVPGDQSGDDGGGFRWRTRIAVAQAAPRPPASEPGTRLPTLYNVSVAISWGADAARAVQLDTQRLGFVAAVGP